MTDEMDRAVRLHGTRAIVCLGLEDGSPLDPLVLCGRLAKCCRCGRPLRVGDRATLYVYRESCEEQFRIVHVGVAHADCGFIREMRDRIIGMVSAIFGRGSDVRRRVVNLWAG